MKHYFLHIFVITFLVLSAEADVINVPADQPTIQAGINAAAHGDTVLVAVSCEVTPPLRWWVGPTGRSEDSTGGASVIRWVRPHPDLFMWRVGDV